MKKNILSFLAALLLFSFPAVSQNSGKGSQLKGSITISGAFALYPMAVKWAEEFRILHPHVKIDISAGGAGKGMTDALTGMADIGMISRDINPEEIKKGANPIAVTKDAVVPTISSKHPMLSFIKTKGIKKSALTGLWLSGELKTWGQALGVKATLPIHVFTRSDAAGAAETWATFLGTKQEDLLGIGVFGDPGLAMAVKKDKVGIGYNNLVYIYDSKTKRATNGVMVIPIDFNNNGKIDPEENFYDSIDDLTKAIVDGRYPSPPARDLYFVTKGKPSRKVVIEFIEFILTKGQNFVHEAGYISLSKEHAEAQFNKIK
jgi:phosphate transport system substrate-binding protein